MHLVARRGDLIVTGGENVYPVEVEQAINAMGVAREALVFGVPDERWGQIVAVVLELEEGPPPDERLLWMRLDSGLASHKRPRLYCTVPDLPRTGSGKLDRAGILDRYRAALRPLRRP